MDFVAHLLWSGILFTGKFGWWAVLFGGLPDLIPFGADTILNIFRKNKKDNHQLIKGNSEDRRISMVSYYNRPENQWVYKLYNYTHSIFIWLIFFIIILLISKNLSFSPIFMYAWLIHILIDIPTHEKIFFAPQFLTPLSKFCINGKSWATRKFMIVNYTLIVIGIILQIIY